MSRIPFGRANEILPVDVKCQADEFENMIRKLGVVFCAEWWGYDESSEFTKEVIAILLERSAARE